MFRMSKYYIMSLAWCNSIHGLLVVQLQV
uniref:Uncharacterized protein n=1 Tax=Rhizophora mucronata TaxID=61149 RepID=A0A2P2QK83_RHIMU